MWSADLPVVMSPIVRAWACQQRGQCCKGHSVPVDLVTFRRMRRTLDAEGDPRAPLMDEDTAENLHGWLSLPKAEEDACVFLEGKLCGWRMRHGTAALPRVCDTYPYVGLVTPRRVLFDLMFSCPTALGLLAREEGHPLIVETGCEWPTNEVGVAVERASCRLLDGTEVDAAGFWDALWDWVGAYGQSSGRPAERLLALTGASPADVARPPADLESMASQAIPATWFRAAMAEGAVELVLATWNTEPKRDYAADPPPPDLDEEAFLGRYVAHRLLSPTGLRDAWSLSRLLTMLFAMLTRYRLERARGMNPIRAVQRVEILAAHASLFATLCPHAHDTRWRLLAGMALATEAAFPLPAPEAAALR